MRTFFKAMEDFPSRSLLSYLKYSKEFCYKNTPKHTVCRIFHFYAYFFVPWYYFFLHLDII